MSKIVIIGAGAMGSAFALPCLDNNHDINIVGTHLENDFIDQLKKNGNLHPGLKKKIPKVDKSTQEKIKHILARVMIKSADPPVRREHRRLELVPRRNL